MAGDPQTQTKEELLRKLGSQTKEDLANALADQLKKDELMDMLSSLKKEELVELVESRREDDEAESQRADERRQRAASLEGVRVRVDVSGLPMMGIYAGRRASAAGTITGVDADKRQVKVYLDAVFDGEKEIVVPPERIVPEG